MVFRETCAATMRSARYTVKRILVKAALLYILAPMVRTYIEAGVKTESVIKCVRWAVAHPGAFYIYENFFKNFLPEPNFGHHPFGTMDEGEIKNSSVYRWKGRR